MENEISITQQYPPANYNLLGNTAVMVSIPDIKSPVVQKITINPNPDEGEVYIQQKATNGYTDRSGRVHPATPNKYAITKNGLKKLADGAGIGMVSSVNVLPTVCRKCVEVNRGTGQIVQCGNCRNKDVAFKVTVSVPQLTGEVLMVEDTNEICVDNVTPGMTDKQKQEFMKFLPQICEAKALNGAIRTALHIKGTYTLEELQKPFVVAYLVPNLNHEDVKKAAIENMFQSSNRLFGSTPNVEQLGTTSAYASIEAGATKEYDTFIDGTYTQEVTAQETPAQPIQQSQQAVQQSSQTEQSSREEDFYCDKCGTHIAERVWDYSINNYGRPLCYRCQKEARNGNRGYN